VINTIQENIKVNEVKPSNVFIQICCSFIRALYQILNYSWEDIYPQRISNYYLIRP
jgi:hypothetical protein